MSEGIPEGTGAVADAAFGGGQENNTGSEESGGINPAWNGLLETLPEGLHGVVTPYLRDWDRGVQERFQQVQSQYAPLESYRPFVENEIDPQTLEQALMLYQMVDQNPQAVWEHMRETYGFGQEQSGQGQPGNPEDFPLEESSPQQFNIESDPRFQALQQQVEQLTGGLQSAYEAQQAAEADAQLDQTLSGLREQHGIQDDGRAAVIERAAIGLAMTGMPLDQAYAEVVSNMGTGQSRPNAPTVMPTSGGVPSSQVNPADLSTSDTKALVIQMLKAANQQ